MYRTDEEDSGRPQPILPPVPQPKGWAFFLGTWSGRLILLNTLIFVLLSWDSGDVMMPTQDALVRWGAKDNVLLARGEYWRFFTPVFVHIGLIHFAVNNWALYILGYQLEFLLKPKWFLLIYLLAGIGGNVASAVFSLGLSAGASGALFGLLGAGFYLERAIGSKLAEMGGKRPRASIYTGMVVANIALGLLIPMIDNAAHMGGLVVGIICTYALLRLRTNRLIPLNPTRGRLALGFLTCLFLLGLGLSCSGQYVRQRYQDAAMDAEQPGERAYYLTQLLRLEPEDIEARLQRLKLALLHGDLETANTDLARLREQGIARERFLETVSELRSLGAVEAANWLRSQLGDVY